LWISHKCSAYWIRESARRPDEKKILSIWSSGRITQLKMPAGRLKHKYRSMGILCRSSWTGVHESLQAREYDAGASFTASEPAWNAIEQLDKTNTSFEIVSKIIHQP
jgi:hypothetical protein